MMPKTRRKEALCRRARNYASKMLELRGREHGSYTTDIMDAYEKGYRAAMRDARAAWGESPSHTMSVENLLDFLRPLK